MRVMKCSPYEEGDTPHPPMKLPHHNMHEIPHPTSHTHTCPPSLFLNSNDSLNRPRSLSIYYTFPHSSHIYPHSNKFLHTHTSSHSDPHTPTTYTSANSQFPTLISSHFIPIINNIMFPQEHTSILDQMLQQQFLPPSSPLPIPSPMDRSSSNNSSRWKPNIEVAPNCPRCASTNTKFCYYNNYSLSQPRYFCKGCRRYWTKGGSLRNVPVGGGCRKNRRAKSARHNSQTDRVNGIKSFHEETESTIRDGDGDGDATRQTNGPRDIDMALVFAKFLNQKPSSTGEEFENGTSSSSNNFSNSLETESDAVIQPQKNDSNPIQDTRIQNFGGDELNLSGIDELEGFLVDEDVLWSDATISSSSATSWQPSTMQMQLQELEFSMPLNEEDQLFPISSTSTVNLISDSWSSFDLSAMEVFSSRP